MVGRSLVEGGRGKISVEMFNPLDEDIFLWNITCISLLHPVEVEENAGMLGLEDDCLGTVAGSSGNFVRRYITI